MPNEPRPKARLATALVAFAAFAAMIGGFAMWNYHAHPPYKWPAIPPPAPMPHPNAYDYYETAYKMIKENNIVGNGWLNPSPSAIAMGFKSQTQADLDRAAAENLPVIAKVRESFKYPYKSPPRRSFNVPFPEYAHERDVARVMLFEGLFVAQSGHYDEALQIEIDTIRFGNGRMSDESFIGPLVGFACEAIGRRHAWDLTGKVSATAAKSAAKRLIVVDDSIPAARAIEHRDEVCMEARLIDLVRTPGWQQTLASSSQSVSSSPLVRFLQIHQYDYVTPETVMQHYVAYMDAENRRLALSYPAFLKASKPYTPDDPLTGSLINFDDKMCIKRDETYAVNELLATMLAIRAYRLDHGSYPAALKELMPGYLPRMPSDPFTDGKALVYRLTTTGYLLYSVGPDGKDDGGKPIFDPSRKGAGRYFVNPNIAGDIVAGVNY